MTTLSLSPDKILETPINTSLYPFTSRYLQLKVGKMHYIDEGKGETILFVHGTPAWSFLYREQIKALSKNYRCIAPDHIGFGLSDKPADFSGTPESHSKNLEQLIERLQLNDITLVVHDFGGPIGLSYAISLPEKIKKIVLFNTWLWETKNNKDIQKVDKILNSCMGRFIYLNLNFSPKYLLKKSFHQKEKLTKEIHRHYTDVFPDKVSRFGLLKIGQALLGSSDWYQKQWEQFEKISNKPFLILWGMKDEFIKPDFLTIWKNYLSNAKVVELECGHFVQEEEPEKTTKAILQFLETK